MRAPKPAYPVDRYLVHNNINNELVNIINEDIWNPDPAMRPEDEITLRKLHEMLRSTADDLRHLSCELTKHHEPGIQVKTKPTPLDEEFNEKVHIEEIVNAKFHGYKIIDGENNSTPSKKVQKDVVDGLIKTIADIPKRKHVVTTGVQVDEAPKKKITNKNLVKSQTKVLQVDNGKEKINNIKSNTLNNASCIGYNEFSYKYVEPKSTLQTTKNLQLQELPKINIRSELKVQNVLRLDIFPDDSSKSNLKNLGDNNATVVFMKHEPVLIETNDVNVNEICKIDTSKTSHHKSVDRKVFKMQTSESSDSTEQLNSIILRQLKLQKKEKKLKDSSPSSSMRDRKHTKSKPLHKQERSQLSLNEWKQNFNAAYGHTSSSKQLKKGYFKTKMEPRGANHYELKYLTAINANRKRQQNIAEYIPYSKLTLGGVAVSDVEKEIGNISDKGDIPLGPILEKILSSRENSTRTESPSKQKSSKKILSTSDENLFREVIDIQNKVKNTISENVGIDSLSDEANDTYADDFDDERSGSMEKKSHESEDEKSLKKEESSKESNNTRVVSGEKNIIGNIRNETFTKSNSLSFKNSVDVYEYVHEINTQDSATQINMSNKISLKETQTSSTYDKNNIQSIHNDLCPSTDPLEEVEQMFKLEKELIKKLIMDEYGDLFEKTLNKPSTSGSSNAKSEINERFSQKDTQTSPAHVKNVMTSPTRHNTRTMSPLVLLKVNRQTSPMIIPGNEEQNAILKNELDRSSISLNMSSPRFSLRLPQTSRDVISNLDTKLYNKDPQTLFKNRSKAISSSSSPDEDYSSSDISSLGEIERISKKYRKLKLSTSSEQSSSPKPRRNLVSYDVHHLRSEGEVSLSQNNKNIKNNVKNSKSEGEVSLGELRRRAKK